MSSTKIYVIIAKRYNKKFMYKIKLQNKKKEILKQRQLQLN